MGTKNEETGWRRQMGENGYQFFLGNYTTEHTFKAIMRHV